MTDRIANLTAALADRYAVERELGGGHTATVYLAEDRKHRRPVAIKVLRPEAGTAAGSDRFLREIEIVAALRHPHILPLHDSGRAGGCLYFVMPYVEGESLRTRLEREGSLAIGDAVRIARETADALAYAHARGVLHRDVKPENILLDSDHAVVADFGVALALGRLGHDRLTDTGGTPGTPLYMSPEQAGGGGPIDVRTDIYSLGCVLYEMLVGEAPYRGSTTQVTIARKMFEPVPAMRVVRETIPEPLEAATRRALARMPADRFQTAAELSEALAGAAGTDAGAITAPPRSPGYVGDAASADGRGPGGLLPSSPGSAATVVLGLAAIAALVLLIGFLNVRVLDYRLRVPASLSPSRSDFPVVGLHAVVPFAVYVTLAFLLYEVAGAMLRGLGLVARRVPVIGPTLERWPERASRRWHALWTPLDAGTRAEAFLLVAVAGGGALLAAFWPLLRSMWWLEAESTALLSCSHRPLHRTYQGVTPVAVAILGVAWFHVFRGLRDAGGGERRVLLARWGSGVWIVLLFVLTAMPWQLLWGSDRERALLEGEPAYIVAEDEGGLLLYRAEEGVTTRHARNESSGLRRLGVSGYLFEEPEAFRSGRPGCEAITSDPPLTEETP